MESYSHLVLVDFIHIHVLRVPELRTDELAGVLVLELYSATGLDNAFDSCRSERHVIDGVNCDGVFAMCVLYRKSLRTLQELQVLSPYADRDKVARRVSRHGIVSDTDSRECIDEVAVRRTTHTGIDFEQVFGPIWERYYEAANVCRRRHHVDYALVRSKTDYRFSQVKSTVVVHVRYQFMDEYIGDTLFIVFGTLVGIEAGDELTSLNSSMDNIQNFHNISFPSKLLAV